MFEQLLETEPNVAEVKGRKTYFVLSAAAMVIALSTALIISLFAIDLNIGMDEMAMDELVAPIEIQPDKAPELDAMTKQPQKMQAPGGSSAAPTRQVIMARVDETPREVPATVSTMRTASLARPSSDFVKLGSSDSDAPGGNGSGRGTGNGIGDGIGDGTGDGTGTVAKVEDDVAPPPPVKKAPEKPVIVSMGVINGRATSLPLPAIPAAAKSINAAGTVSVKILVDETGKVVSASAISGNPLLREASEIAARGARFTPTLLSGKPVKISGTIDYRFGGSGSSSD